MSKKSFVVFLGLFLSQLVSTGYGQYQGTFFGRANFDFSVPFVFVSKYESKADNTTVLGDYYYDQFSMPFYISLELAYLAAFTKEHRLMGIWNIKYSDDPVNFFFTESTKTKLNATQFNSQNLNNFVVLKYIWNINSNYELSPSFHASFDFNRDSRFEEFIDNFYNSQIYGVFMGFKMKNLGDSVSELSRMIFDFNLGYSYNYLPNSVVKRDLADIPDTKEDFQSIDFNFNYGYGFHPNFSFNVGYRLNFKAYVEKVVHTGDIDKGYSDDNQKDLINNLDLSFNMSFFDRGDYRLLDVTTAFSLGYLYSTHVELIEMDRGLIGNYSLPDDAIFVNNSYHFYQSGFKDYISGLTGLYFRVNFNANHSLRLGYTFSLKRYMNDYGRLGTGLNTTRPQSPPTSSGEVESFPIDSYGVYTDEKRQDLFNTFSLGYTWKSDSRDRLIYPYFGMQKSDSNDQTKKINRYIFVLGFKASYEF